MLSTFCSICRYLCNDGFGLKVSDQCVCLKRNSKLLIQTLGYSSYGPLDRNYLGKIIVITFFALLGGIKEF